jgi:hypothetical protein
MMAAMLEHSSAKQPKLFFEKVFFCGKKSKENLSTGNQMTIIKTYFSEVIDSWAEETCFFLKRNFPHSLLVKKNVWYNQRVALNRLLTNVLLSPPLPILTTWHAGVSVILASLVAGIAFVS